MTLRRPPPPPSIRMFDSANLTIPYTPPAAAPYIAIRYVETKAKAAQDAVTKKKRAVRGLGW